MLWPIGILTLVCIIDSATTASITSTAPPMESVSVWMGQSLFLPCESDKELGTYRRLWLKESELLTAATVVISFDERVRVVNDVNLEIQNITADDSGEYTCVIVLPSPVKRKFEVNVREVTCPDPDDIPNSVMDPPRGSIAEHHFRDQVTYTCAQGYTLVGDAIRTCLLPGVGWDGSPPSCELEIVANVARRMTTLENKLMKLLNIDMETILKVEEKFSALEGRVSELENGGGTLSTTRKIQDGVDREMFYLKKVLNLNAIREAWEKFLNAPIARLGVRDGHVVSEYTWLINDIETKVVSYRDKPFDYIESPAFYTHVPGYRMVLHFFPHYDESDHAGLYAVLLRGRFDDVVSWPFTSKYVMSIGTLNEEESDVYDTIVPARIQSCKFERPPPDNSIGCGFGRFLPHETLRINGNLHKIDGNILVRISIFLDD